MGLNPHVFSRSLYIGAQQQLEKLMAFNDTLVARVDLLKRTNLQGASSIRVKDECNYPDNIRIEDYIETYKRDGIGTRVCNVIPTESWTNDPDVFQSRDPTLTTAFERRLNRIVYEHNLWGILAKLDEVTGIGSYGGMLIGIDDGLRLNQPIENVGKDGLPLDKKKKKEVEITYLRIVDESDIRIKEVERDTSSPRYGLPTMFEIRSISLETSQTTFATILDDGKGTSIEQWVDVHWHRFLNTANNSNPGSFVGLPEMMNVYNDIINLEKILGAAGEGFWRCGFPGISIETVPNANIVGSLEDDLEDIKSQLRRYQRGLDRGLVLDGMTAKTMSPAITDPSPFVKVLFEKIACSKNCPLRIFMGSEQAKLASEQDSKKWFRTLNTVRRRKNTYGYVLPTIRRFMAIGILPYVPQPVCEWTEIDEGIRSARVDISSKLIVALTNYVSYGLSAIMDPVEFLSLFDINREDAERIIKKSQAQQVLTPKVKPVEATFASKQAPAAGKTGPPNSKNSKKQGSDKRSQVSRRK